MAAATTHHLWRTGQRMTTRLLATIGLLATVGCLPRRDLQPFVAVSGQYALMDAAVGPTPAPLPAPDGKCKACNGTGRLGDGRVWTVCQSCGGDGIVGAACKDGKCQTTTR